jgi:molybdate transport repressor ModE-like protein
MHARTKVWIEHDGKIVLGDGRVQLLEEIDKTGSLREAARQLGMPYRRAWAKLRETETNFGAPLVESVHGGTGGGGESRLTDDAKRLVSQYQRLAQTMDRHLQAEFPRAFKS